MVIKNAKKMNVFPFVMTLHKYVSHAYNIAHKNKITRSSMFEYLLLKVEINYTQYFAKNPIGIIR